MQRERSRGRRWICPDAMSFDGGRRDVAMSDAMTCVSIHRSRLTSLSPPAALLFLPFPVLFNPPYS